MINFSEATLSRLAIHQVGNKSGEQGIKLSDSEVALNGDIKDILNHYFTKPFRQSEMFNFYHDSGLQFSEMYAFAKNIFGAPARLLEQSVQIARHLYEQSDHPNIKDGELYVAYLENCRMDNMDFDAVGIFKSEQKETYLKVYPEGRNFQVSHDNGININKLDKGCLILNSCENEGYIVLTVDNTNKEDAQYWRKDFLGVRPREDAYFNTKNYLQLCRDFAVEAFPEADRLDQMSLIQESAKYFKEEETFDKASFREKVLQEPELIQAFENYKQDYESKGNFRIDDEFDINSDAVKKMNKVFKSVIKLDRNFHIYVHGNHSLIRRGFDEESGMGFYQLFYIEES
jgi:hypothetical protein